VGGRADALAAYGRARQVLVEELGVEPGPGLRVLEGAILEHRPELAGPTAARLENQASGSGAVGRIGVLPVATSTLVGRAAEREELANLLEGHRLVTLTGAGGTGKTRLALAVGGGREPKGDVVFCDLAIASSPGAVVQAVARAAGMPAESLSVVFRLGHDPPEYLVDHLRVASVLIILDNCEHVLEACAQVADRVLGGCPEVRVLATSREPLGVPGEQLFPVPPLPVPSDVDDLGADAVTLFVQRAAEVRPGFTLDAANRAAVVEICRRLDGLPLAVELAAARMSHLTPMSVAERLDQRFELLATTRGTRSSRHRRCRRPSTGATTC
jgi:predicted ATPase